MARKVSTKVKTGCFTCKIRKVKCDEARPNCMRCCRTGRKCDGYPTNPTPKSSALSPTSTALICSRSPSLLPTVTVAEARALDFFQNMIAPQISGHMDSKFWTNLVLQVSQQEPAVRHAAVAISSLYEDFDEPKVSNIGNKFALQHYSTAIRNMVSTTDETAVLFTCVLMVCVEFLQGHVQAAIQHCRYGVSILNSPSSAIPQWTRDQLMPIFSRLSVFPYFFGETHRSFPALEGMDELVRHATDPGHVTVNNLQTRMDVLLARCMRFVRECDAYCVSGTPAPAALLSRQQSLLSALEAWDADLAAYKLPPHLPLPDSEAVIWLMLQMRALTASIWISKALEYDEGAYDVHLPQFQAIVELGSLALAATLGVPRPKFIFEMGFLPVLYFVVIKCRHLETRVAALRLVKLLAVRRENLWDVDTFRLLGTKIIELEHGVRLDLTGLDNTTVEEECRVGEGRAVDGVVDTVVPPDPLADALDALDARSSRQLSFFLPGDGGEAMEFRERVLLVRGGSRGL